MLLKINREGVLKIFCAVLFSCFLSFVILPFLFKLDISKKILGLNDNKFFIGVSAFTICILLISWNNMNKFWKKYKETYRIEQPNILYIDLFAVIITGSFIFVFLFHQNEIANIPVKFMRYSFFNLLLFVSWFGSSFYWVKEDRAKKIAITQGEMSLSDSPIEYEEQDLLDRDLFIDNLLKEIIAVSFTDSFVYGLFGKWGEGKTSVLNLLTKRFKKEENFLIVNFDPWHFHDTKSMFTAFYKQIENVLSNKYLFTDIKNTFKRYRNLLSTGVSQSGISFNFRADDESLENVRSRIESYINQTQKKLVIIIDDIDRLAPSDIMQVFKLVRLNSNFAKTIFILSFDYEIVVRKLNESYFGHGGEYIKKIIQKPIILPKLEQKILDRYFFYSDHEIPKYSLNELTSQKGYISTWGFVNSKNDDLLIISPYQRDSTDTKYKIKVPEEKRYILKQLTEGDKIFVKGLLGRDKFISVDSADDLIIKFRLSLIDTLFQSLIKNKKIKSEDLTIFDKEVSYLYKTKLSLFLTTLREIKRFIQSFSTSIYPIAEEIDLKDFFLLEVIKVFEPELYNHIYDNWWLYVDQRDESDRFISPFVSFLGKEDKKKEEIKNYIEINLKKLCEDQFKRQFLKDILSELFSNVRDEFHGTSSEGDPSKEIDSTNFLKYFLMKVPSFELSHTYIETIIQEWNNDRLIDEPELKDLFEKLHETGQLLEFLDKLKNIFINKIETKTARLLINLIYKQIDLFSLKGTEDLWNSERDSARYLMLRLINDRIEKGLIQETIEGVILNTPNLNFACLVVLNCKQERRGGFYNIYENIDFKKLTGSISMRLREYFVDQNRDLLKAFPEAKEWVFILYQWGTNWGLETKLNREIVGGYLISIINNDIKNFVKLVDYYNNNESEMFNSNKIVDINKIVEIAEKLKNNKELNNDERSIIERFISKAKSASEKLSD
jgi:predicted KAP-like P-loop ATPase